MEGHQQELDRTIRDAKRPVLTSLESRVLARYASGARMAEIAAEEFRSERQMDRISEIIKEKLSAENLAQAVLIAHQLGFISDPDDNLVVSSKSPRW